MRVLFGSLVVLALLGSSALSQDSKGVKLIAVEKEILDLTNAARQENNAAPLSPNPILMTLARDHSDNQAKQGKMSHNLDGKSPVDRVRASAYKFRTTGENVAYNQRVSGKEIFDMWMKSPGHRKNILNPAYNEIGIGMGAGNGAFYYTQVFGRSAGAVNAPLPLPPKLTPPKLAPPKSAVPEIPLRALQSTGWLTSDSGKPSTGAGVLVDRELRLFVTAYHLVEGAPAVKVHFSAKDAKGKTNSDPIVGDLVIRSTKRDLAVFRLKSLPPDVSAVKLAETGVNSPDRIFTVANAGGNDSLAAADGAVRQTIFKKFRLNEQQDVAAWTIESTFPLDKSERGAPVVNGRGELVGIASAPDPSAPLVHNCVELREIRAILDLARSELTSGK